MRNRFMRACALSMLAAVTSPGWTQVQLPDEYGRHIRQSSELAAGEGMFGDRIDLNSGGLEIIQTDVDLPGNGAPVVRVGRRYRPSDIYGAGHFSHWDMDLPHAHGTFSKAAGWRGWDNDIGKRCSKFSAPPEVMSQGGLFSPDEYWSGSFLYLPGGGEQEMLARGGAHVPSDGHAYPVVTKQGAAVRCVALAATSESGTQGEGFEVVTPDGMVYTLNQMVTRIERPLSKANPDPMLLSGGTRAATPGLGPTVGLNYVLSRVEILLYPTQVRDRFGNVVTYVWSTTNPWQLLRIEGNDGRRLNLAYQSPDSSNWVTSVSDGSRTWRYGYDLGAGALNEVDTLTLPDGSAWTYRLGRLTFAAANAGNYSCDQMTAPTATYVGSMTSPSGATIEFTMGSVLFGRSWVFRECIHNLDDSEYAREPYLFVGLATASKKITGPGLPAAGLSWSYSYGAPNHCWHPATVPGGTDPAVACTASSPDKRVVSVTDPDGTVTRHIFGNRYLVDEGMLLEVQSGWNGTSAMRSVATAYGSADAEPYAAFNGYSVRNLGDYDITSRLRPQRQAITTQQGRTFTWEVAATCGSSGTAFCFDAFARPTRVTRSSAPAP